MTTSREFMQKQFGNANGETKSLSSIYKDSKGNIYSYGHHYPLLFKIGDLSFINNTGYSNTTSRHIHWARTVAPEAINVWLSGCNQYSWRNTENRGKVPALLNANLYHDGDKPHMTDMLMKSVFADLEAELVDINNRIASKKRTDTQIYKSLLAERMDCVDRIASVRPYLK